MRARILLTGFKPFGDLEVNPTEQLMQTIAAPAGATPASEDGVPGAVLHGAPIETAILDVDYVLAERQFREALLRFTPDAVLSFGVSGGTDELCLERIAVNVDDASIPDGSGERRAGSRIVEGGPVGYWATLGLEGLYAALAEAGLPVRYSNHAGTYLCNHLFYYGLHTIASLGLETRMGFLHVPPLPEQIKEGGRAKVGMGLERLAEAARVCVRVVAGAIAPVIAREAVGPEPGAGS